MTNEEILKKAIEKAVENGYKLPNDWELFKDEEHLWGWHVADYDGERDCTISVNIEKEVNTFIFDHEFVKAFWGEKLKEKGKPIFNDDGIEIGWKGNGEFYFVWQYHLQTMVIEKEPLKYLEKFL